MAEFLPQYIEIEEAEEPEKPREWREVLRKHPVAFLGDVNGSLHGFLKNAQNTGVLELTSRHTGQPFPVGRVHDRELLTITRFEQDTQVRWRGGDTRLIILGDILGDRSALGVPILETIHRLSQKAQTAGGEVITLAGNHDIAVLKMLLYGESRAGLIDGSNIIFRLDEYARFAQELLPMEENGPSKNFPPKQNVKLNLDEIYHDEAMVAHIELIKKTFSLVALIDDSLFTHRDLSPVDFPVCYWNYQAKLKRRLHRLPTAHEVIENINRDFRLALEEAFPIQTAQGKKFVDRKNQNSTPLEFLCRPDRPISVLSGWPAKRFFDPDLEGPQKYPEDFIEFLQLLGINTLVFGHTAVNIENDGEDFLAIAADGESNKGKRNKNFSCGIISTKGKIQTHIGQTKMAYRSS